MHFNRVLQWEYHKTQPVTRAPQALTACQQSSLQLQGLIIKIQLHTASMRRAQCKCVLTGLHGLSKQLLNVHVTQAPWGCNSASYNNTMSHGLNQCNAMSHRLDSMHCNVARAQLNAMQHGLNSIECDIAFGLNGLETHFNSIHQHVKLYLP